MLFIYDKHRQLIFIYLFIFYWGDLLVVNMNLVMSLGNVTSTSSALGTTSEVGVVRGKKWTDLCHVVVIDQKVDKTSLWVKK